MTVQADMTISDALAKIDQFDILLVPGGWPTLLLDMIKTGNQEMKFIEAFNGSSTSTGDEKIIFSVCTGALLLGGTGRSPRGISFFCKVWVGVITQVQTWSAQKICAAKQCLSDHGKADCIFTIGVLSNLKATTHHLSLDMLRDLDKSVDVVSSLSSEGTPKRYVDGGMNKQGKRIVTAGGITCGMDAALYIAELKAGREAAEFVATMSEHEWKRA